MKHNPVALICISAILLYTSCNSAFHQPAPQPITAILGAFDEEVIPLKEQLQNKHEQTIEGIKFVTGRLKTRKVVIASTGIGKVNAAMTTILVIEHFRPNEVIFTGIAGGLNPQLLHGDIIIAEKIAQHDLGIWTETGLENRGEINPFTGIRNPIFFPADKQLLKLAERAAEKLDLEKIKIDTEERTPKIVKGTVVTGDVFVVSTAKRTELRNRLTADAVEMEGAAVAQICYQHNIPYLAIRSICNKADEKVNEDLDRFTEIAAKNSAALAAEIVGLLSTNQTVKNDINDK